MNTCAALDRWIGKLVRVKILTIDVDKLGIVVGYRPRVQGFRLCVILAEGTCTNIKAQDATRINRGLIPKDRSFGIIYAEPIHCRIIKQASPPWL